MRSPKIFLSTTEYDANFVFYYGRLRYIYHASIYVYVCVEDFLQCNDPDSGS